MFFVDSPCWDSSHLDVESGNIWIGGSNILYGRKLGLGGDLQGDTYGYRGLIKESLRTVVQGVMWVGMLHPSVRVLSLLWYIPLEAALGVVQAAALNLKPPHETYIRIRLEAYEFSKSRGLNALKLN